MYFTKWPIKFGTFFHSTVFDVAFVVHCTALFYCFTYDIIILLGCMAWVMATFAVYVRNNVYYFNTKQLLY